MEDLNSTISHSNRNLPHFAVLPNEAISILTPYSGLILTTCLTLLFFIKHYLLEQIVFRKFYRIVYSRMDDGMKRGFMNHHIAGGCKIVIIFAGAKPFFDVVFGHSQLSSPLSNHRPHPTMGDMLLVCCHLFCSMYLFELFFRKTLSPIAVMHHVGAIMIGQSAIALSLNLDHEKNATIEFVLCTVWGVFDVLAEGWLNLAFILYRLRPNSHHFLIHLFASAGIITVLGSTIETIVIMYLFGKSWEVWEIEFKVITPILHIVFTLAQLHGSKILFLMYLKQKRLLAEEQNGMTDPEGGMQKNSDESERTLDPPGNGSS
jgi:hypothetical protein